MYPVKTSSVPGLQWPWAWLLLALIPSGCSDAPSGGAPEEDRAAAAQAQERPRLRPFEDLAPEADPPSKRRTQGPFSGTLAERLVWKRALETAAEAEGHYELAEQAHRDSDREALNREGGEARRLYNQALEDTAEFEEELIVDHGEEDDEVAAIVKVRNGWFDRLRWLHKTVGR